MSDSAIESGVKQIVAKYVKTDLTDVDRSTELQALNIESLDLIEIIFEIEDKYDVSIDQDEKSANLKTVGEMFDWLIANIKAQKTA